MNRMIQSSTVAAAPASDRRGFLRAAAVLPVIAALGMLKPRTARAAVNPPLTFADIPGEGDVKVLNYALALEALEADLYSQAVMRLTNGGTNGLGQTIRGLRIKDDKLKAKTQDAFYYRVFGQVEAEHRDFLDAALGEASLLNLAPFSTAQFDFGINELSRQEVGELVLLAEKTGVGAYLGAIPFLSSRVYLQIAGAIQGTEARHTAVLADALSDQFRLSENTAPLFNENSGIDQAIAPDTVLAAVSPFIVLA